MKPPVLRNLYHLLKNLSLNAQWNVNYSVSSHNFDLEMCHDGIKLTFIDISELSNILFKQLDEKFEQIFSNLSRNYDIGESSSNLGLFDAVEIMNSLFRCCLMLLTLLGAQQNLVLEKGLILLRIVRKLSLPDLVENKGKQAFVIEESFFRECGLGDNGCSTSSVEGFTASLQFLGPNNPLLFFMSTMLEVLVDELLSHGLLRSYFKMINAFASTNETLFSPHSFNEDIGIAVEVLCHHFILSFSQNQAFGHFLGRLFCTHATELKYPSQAPALSINTAVSLLLSPIMVCTPKLMQAHLILLFSEAVYTKKLKPDRKLTNCCFLSSFEKSVDLYTKHMSCLEKDGFFNFPMAFFQSGSSCGISYPRPFQFYTSPETRKKVNGLIAKLDDPGNVKLSDISFRMKSDLVSSSMRFVKECLNVYSISSAQDEILSVLSCLVLKASDDNEIRPIEHSSLQHLYFLASLLKLMGVSLLQAISCLGRNDDDSSCVKSLKDLGSCKEYDFILEIITRFRDLDVSLPLQQDLVYVMSSHSTTRHSHSKMMFLHFSGLMSLSFGSGLDCLVKACLLVILGMLNLFVFEEGDLDAFRSLIDSDQQHVSSGLSLVRLQETVVDQNSSLVVASKFHKIRATRNKDNENEILSIQALANESSDMETVAGLEEEETEETSNGEIFLKCMLKTGKNVSDVDDLVDFVECKQGKDYSAWLKNRHRFRKWRFEKLAVLKWKKKKKTWKTLKGRRN
ncbi:hypothetical protein PHJA_000283500 [Phtheirospermum japonicum]|uniref:DUF7812 domain-containing protein n=1 Tax=Phtheirospermum japonicum TaxID=374723 RepID=A0A830B6I8_9LAMI|nr:hypothetical protein PHJA_000283500 [Phtheirospermum japonicum]